MERITEKMLKRMVERLNTITNNPQSMYTRSEKGSIEANEGHYCLDYAYGGVKLCQMCKGGGQRNISRHGFGTKRELYNCIQTLFEVLA